MKYQKLDPEFKNDFFNLTDNANSIVITSHFSPDEDSISSVMTMLWLLREKYSGKDIKILYSGEPVDRFKSFDYYNEIKFVPDIADEISETDVLIMLDAAKFERFSAKPDVLKSKAKKTISIDHHASPGDDFDLSIVDTSIPANAEMLYRIFFEDREISQEVAQMILLGILADTGNFAFLKPEQSETMIVAKRLIEIMNTSIQEFQSKYRLIPIRCFEIISELIKNTEYHMIGNWPGLQTSYISRKFIEDNDFTDTEISAGKDIYIAQYVRLIEGYPWGFASIPKMENSASVSLRSLPNSVNVRLVAERMNVGGGHDRAAGGFFKDIREPEDVIKTVVEWLKNNEPLIS